MAGLTLYLARASRSFTPRWLLEADVMLGSLISTALFNKRIPEASTSLIEYNQRLEARDAYQRASAASWGP